VASFVVSLPTGVIGCLHVHELIAAAQHLGRCVAAPPVGTNWAFEGVMRVALLSRAPDRFDAPTKKAPDSVRAMDI
jgi:hypothetical protein